MKSTSTPARLTSMLRDSMLLHLVKQRKGASLAQIRKHLDASCATSKLETSSASRKKKMLASTLKGLVQAGKVQKSSGGVYKLKKTAEGTEADKAELPNRRRRRTFPVGYCKTHSRYHRKRRRSRRRRHSRRRRQHHRRRRRHHRRRRR